MPGVISSMKKDKAGHGDGDHWGGGVSEAKTLSRDLKKGREEACSELRQEGDCEDPERKCVWKCPRNR